MFVYIEFTDLDGVFINVPTEAGEIGKCPTAGISAFVVFVPNASTEILGSTSKSLAKDKEETDSEA